MNAILKKADNYNLNSSFCLIANNVDMLSSFISDDEFKYVKTQFEEKSKTTFIFDKFDYQIYIVLFKTDFSDYKAREYYRKQANQIYGLCKTFELKELQLINLDLNKLEIFDFVEAFLLGNYEFDKYKTKKSKLIQDLKLFSDKTAEEEIQKLNFISEAVFQVRDWVNEPGSALTPAKFADELINIFSEQTDVKLSVLCPLQIKSLNMAGIVNVNKGSINEARFMILDYVPEGIDLEEEAIVLVGKGIFFDTGGINLKPSPGLFEMKSDMAGAAVVASTLNLISKLKIKTRVIGLIPAAENRPGENAYLPGDILKMMNGKTVEIKNTDAEGRLILADALCYAANLKSKLHLTVATLTGSAHSTFGNYATAAMQNKAEEQLETLKISSFEVYERIAELPMWEEYEKMIDSQVADIQNVGGKFGGAITAAKFLQQFTDKPFIHLDIAGTAFTDKAESYIPSGGTGVGVRLLVDYIEKMAAKK